MELSIIRPEVSHLPLPASDSDSKTSSIFLGRFFRFFSRRILHEISPTPPLLLISALRQSEPLPQSRKELWVVLQHSSLPYNIVGKVGSVLYTLYTGQWNIALCTVHCALHWVMQRGVQCIRLSEAKCNSASLNTAALATLATGQRLTAVHHLIVKMLGKA